MKLLKLLGVGSFYAYLASLFGLGLFGFFLPATELRMLYGLSLDGWEPETAAALLHQYRILKAFVVGFAVFATVHRREIFRVRRYNFLFLFTMFAEVLARPLSLWRDGWPGTTLLAVTITEAVFALAILAWSRTQLEPKTSGGKTHA